MPSEREVGHEEAVIDKECKEILTGLPDDVRAWLEAFIGSVETSLVFDSSTYFDNCEIY